MLKLLDAMSSNALNSKVVVSNKKLTDTTEMKWASNRTEERSVKQTVFISKMLFEKNENKQKGDRGCPIKIRTGH